MPFLADFHTHLFSRALFETLAAASPLRGLPPELLVGTDPMKNLIQEHARVAEMLAVALEEGMLTLKMDGMEKVLQGVTDMPQVRAVCIK